VLIDLAATSDLDVTTSDMLFELVRDLHSRSIEVLLAQVKGSVRDRLRKTGLMAEIGEDRVYLSIGSGVADFGRRWPPDVGAPTDGQGTPPGPGDAPERAVDAEAAPGPEASPGPETPPAPEAAPGQEADQPRP
jgi:hypothetical protein